MKPVVFKQITDKYRNGYYSAQVGPVQIIFDFGEDEIFVEIILWGNFKDLKCNRGLDCPYADTEKCNWSKCCRFTYYTGLVDHLQTCEKYDFIADYFDLPDIEYNPASRLFALKMYITALLLGNEIFFHEPCHIPISLPEQDKFIFTDSPWKIDSVIV